MPGARHREREALAGETPWHLGRISMFICSRRDGRFCAIAKNPSAKSLLRSTASRNGECPVGRRDRRNVAREGAKVPLALANFGRIVGRTLNRSFERVSRISDKPYSDKASRMIHREAILSHVMADTLAVPVRVAVLNRNF